LTSKHLEAQKRYRRRKISQMLDYLGGHCKHCGIDNEEAMEFYEKRLQFDHIDPSQKAFDISPHFSYAWDRIVGELDKCQLLCYGCHLEKTMAERANMRPPTLAEIELLPEADTLDTAMSLTEVLEMARSLILIAEGMVARERS